MTGGSAGGPGRVFAVGLGPGGVDLLLPAARAALGAVPDGRRFVRTSRHPAVAELAAEGVPLVPFDGLYELAPSISEVYEGIADRLTAAAEAGDVCFAVPGSPAVGERSVELLRARLGDRLVVVPGLSFVDLAWARLTVDPTGGARVADGQSLPLALPEGPLLIGHCHNRMVLSDVKLALLERLDGDAAVTVLQRLGLPDESVRRLALADLDREVEPDHLTSVFVELPPGGPGAAWERLVALVERLRAPGGCPWDAEQTHHSLARHLVEETYEVIEAIEGLPASAPGGPDPVPEGAYELLEEELGDLACQVVFHATFAREAGAFTVTDVLSGIHDKLVRRHPHVFGDVSASGPGGPRARLTPGGPGVSPLTPEQVVANWEQIKQEEKGRESLMDGVPKGLPSLLYAHKLLRKAESGGVRFTVDAALAALSTHAARLGEVVPDPSDAEVELGEALAALVELARLSGVDAEAALRGWAARFRARFQRLEAVAAARGSRTQDLGPEERMAIWDQAGVAPD